MSEAEKAYHPAAVSPLAAQLLNDLVTRAAPWPLRLGDARAALTPLALPLSFAPAALLLLAGAEATPWRIALSNAPVRLLPALRNADSGLLPAPLRQAALELLAGSLLAGLARLLGEPLRLTGSVLYDPAGQPETEPVSEVWPDPVCELFFRMDVGDAGAGEFFDDTSGGEGEAPLFVRVDVPDAAGAHRLHEALWALPARRGGVSPQIPDSLPVSLAVEAGRMRLSAAGLREMAVGDILFPEDYPALRNEVILLVGSEPGPVWTALCDVADSAAVLRTPLALHPKPEETTMSETLSETAAGTAPETTTEAPSETTAPGPAFRADDLELTLSFELERRSVAVRDLTALAPGYTFALAADPDAPVTLRAGGKVLGSGRLVDINGTLGVQITALDGQRKTR